LAALASQSFTYDANDRISGDTFDTNGNTLTSDGHTFVYDFQDRLTQYDNTVGMTCDGDGNRVARTEGGTTHRFLIDEQTPTGYPQIAEEVLNGQVIRQHTYGTMRISQRQLLVSPNWQVSYYGGGSVRQLTDPTGAVTDTYAYDALGNTVAQTGTTFNQFLYRGEQFDSTLGMYYLRARYYRPQVGRFLSADKYEGAEVGACDCANRGQRLPSVGTHHLFSYTGPDPVNNIDPTGQENFFINALIRFRVWVGLGGTLLIVKYEICAIWEEYVLDAEKAEGSGPRIGPPPPWLFCASPHDEWPRPGE
jgi:RHS repeat-associated protein